MEVMTNVTDSQGNQRQAFDLAYLAGIMDGEGCIRLGKRITDREGRNCMNFPEIRVGMTDLEPIQMLYETFGGYVDKRSVLSGRTMWVWWVRKRAGVVKVVNALLPYMRVKAQQATLVREYCLLPTFERAGRGKVSDIELRRREELYWKVKQLNATGAAAETNRDDTREGEVIVRSSRKRKETELKCSVRPS